MGKKSVEFRSKSWLYTRRMKPRSAYHEPNPESSQNSPYNSKRTTGPDIKSNLRSNRGPPGFKSKTSLDI